MKFPPLKEWIAQSKRLWDMATPTNRKIFFPNINTWEQYKKVMTDNWKRLSKDPSMFEQETLRTHNALQMAMGKMEKSQEYHDKAMKQVEKNEEGE
jgi:hypothetical protein